MTQETAREVAERLLAEEQEAERQGRLNELVRAEEERRETEQYEQEQQARRAAAKERADALARERVEIVGRIEEAAPALAGLVNEYLALDNRHRAELRRAQEFVPSGTAAGDAGGYLRAVLGDYVSITDPWGDAGSPPLQRRDALCPKDGGEG